MDFVLKNEDNKHLIVLIHGLSGSEKTWKGDNQRFVENLSTENLILGNFDMALYSYGTTILQITWLAKIIRLLRGLFKNVAKEDAKRFNVGIDKVAMPLVARLNGIHTNYETISIIAHSMGGLVAKSALTWLDNELLKKIYFFMSLSVPHIGAHLATSGRALPVIGRNPQIADLQAMGAFTTSLNQRFGNISPQPKIIYQWGTQDTIVPEQSAYPPNVLNNLTIATEDDHFSVLLIKDRSTNSVYNKILGEFNMLTMPFLEIEADIPSRMQFKSFIDTILRSKRFTGIRIDFDGFSDPELGVELRDGKIKANNLEEFLIKVGELSINKLPKYSIERENRTYNFTLKAKKDE